MRFQVSTPVLFQALCATVFQRLRRVSLQGTASFPIRPGALEGHAQGLHLPGVVRTLAIQHTVPAMVAHI